MVRSVRQPKEAPAVSSEFAPATIRESVVAEVVAQVVLDAEVREVVRVPGKGSKKNKKEVSERVDESKRLFLRLAGIAGLGVVASTVLPKNAQAYVMGSSPTSGVVGLKNGSNVRVDPATEGGNLASIKTNTDPLVSSGGGGYVRQDSTATIAKETGGNLATIAGKDFATEATLAEIKAQTDKFTFSGSNLLTSGGGGGGGAVTVNDTTDTQINPATDEGVTLLRRLVKQSDSLAVVDSAQRQKVTIDSISGSLTLGTITTVGTVTAVTTVSTVTTVGTVTSATNLVALGGVDGRYLHIDTARNMYANGIRSNLAFS